MLSVVRGPGAPSEWPPFLGTPRHPASRAAARGPRRRPGSSLPFAQVFGASCCCFKLQFSVPRPQASLHSFFFFLIVTLLKRITHFL